MMRVVGVTINLLIAVFYFGIAMGMTSDIGWLAFVVASPFWVGHLLIAILFAAAP